MAKQKKKAVEETAQTNRYSVVQMPALMGACVLREYKGFDILLKSKPNRPVSFMPGDDG